MEIKTSVRSLVEYSLRSGDIDDSYVSQNRMVQGIRAHQKLQKEYGPGYKAEYKLTNTSEYGGMVFRVEGRADGIITNEDIVIVDEIKSTTRDLEVLEDSPLHWAQAKCYAYFYALDKGQEEMGVQLSYYNIDQDATKRFRDYFSLEDLKEFYEDILLSYLDLSQKLSRYRTERNASLVDLDFPFPYRKGQRDLAVAVYRSIEDKKNLFCEAPTGIGKTMSCLYPAVKAMARGLVDKVFYLTARSTTKDQGQGAAKILVDKGLAIRSVTLTAKEKSCLNDTLKCNPRDCPYAKGHFDRVNDALSHILEEEVIIDFETLQAYGREHMVCPFELQLDLATYVDLVICDYNYVFDPRVYLRRFFDAPMDAYVFLVDEAHNLVDRGRTMYSAELKAADFLDLIEVFDGPYMDIKKALSMTLSKMESYRPKMEEENLVMDQEPEDIGKALRGLMAKVDGFLAKEKDHPSYDRALDLYFKMSAYIRISELYDQGYRTIFTLDEEDMLVVKLLCIDTSEKFKGVLEAARSAIFFSATLTPMDFYKDLLGGGNKDYKYHLESPFDKDRLFLAALSISTKYKDRDTSILPICQAIKDVIKSKEGNYIVFFPSYNYMDWVYRDFIRLNPDVKTTIQERSMSEADREDFIREFIKEDKLLGFAVLGGVFSEGIDLVGDGLIGTLIISVGLPGLSFERNVIRDFFDERESMGYPYAYQYPGMNKVLQAAGRVIRTEEDEGVVVLIDDRYLNKSYRSLMPRHYKGIRNYYETESLADDIGEFWKGRG